jgi:hypothetical protein
MTFSLPELNLKRQICSSWEFNVDDPCGSSSTYDIIIGRDLLGDHNLEYEVKYNT